jgi:Raf kinase inhibitor-like YbhB/YbcL family protein
MAVVAVEAAVAEGNSFFCKVTRSRTKEGYPNDALMLEEMPRPTCVGLAFPEQTRSFVITCIDINAENFVHWVVYDIPVNNIDIPEGASGNFLNPIKEGQNDFEETGYGGPAPPANERHQYRFTVYALSVATLGLPDGASYDQVISAMQGKVLARAELTGLYP